MRREPGARAAKPRAVRTRRDTPIRRGSIFDIVCYTEAVLGEDVVMQKDTVKNCTQIKRFRGFELQASCTSFYGYGYGYKYTQASGFRLQSGLIGVRAAHFVSCLLISRALLEQNTVVLLSLLNVLRPWP